MKNLVVTVILVGVLGYFGAKFYLHYEVSSNLDAALDMARPFADIQYDGVSSTMTGKLSVDRVSARFGSFRDRVEIDQVSIITPGFWYLMNLGDMGQTLAGSNPELPDSFGFAVTGLRAKVSDDFMKALSNAAREASPNVDDEDVAGNCAGKHGFSMETLRHLGYTDLVMSFSMGYRKDGRHLLVDMWADVEEMYAMKVDLILADQLNLQSLARGIYRPRMVEGRFEYEDHSLLQRTRDLCRRRGVDADDVTVAQLEAFRIAGMESGIAFDEYVMEPYEKFLAGGSRFVLTAKPSEPITLTQIDLYKPEDVPALLNLSAEVL
jgi:hypothetical protein